MRWLSIRRSWDLSKPEKPSTSKDWKTILRQKRYYLKQRKCYYIKTINKNYGKIVWTGLRIIFRIWPRANFWHAQKQKNSQTCYKQGFGNLAKISASPLMAPILNNKLEFSQKKTTNILVHIQICCQYTNHGYLF